MEHIKFVLFVVEKPDSKGVLCILGRRLEENIKILIKGIVLQSMY
jgi:hypothetical protein